MLKKIHVIVFVPVLAAGVLVSNTAWSMDSLSDTQLAATTGQDGISLLITPPTLATALASGQTTGLKIGAALLHDKDGFTGYTSAGALIFGDASQSNAANAVGTQMGIYGSSAIPVVVDASGGSGAPKINISIQTPADFLFRTGDVSLGVSARTGIAVGAAGATVANASIGKTTGAAYKIMNSLDVGLGAVTLNLQLGSAPQGGMLKFTNFNIASINFYGTKVSLASPNAGAEPASQLSFTPVVSNLNLTGAIVDVVANMSTAVAGFPATGGVILQTASASIGNFAMNDLTAGTSGSTSTTTFSSGTKFADGMLNAPLGSFGVAGMTVTGLKVGVSGL